MCLMQIKGMLGDQLGALSGGQVMAAD